MYCEIKIMISGPRVLDISQMFYAAVCVSQSNSMVTMTHRKTRKWWIQFLSGTISKYFPANYKGILNSILAA